MRLQLQLVRNCSCHDPLYPLAFTVGGKLQDIGRACDLTYGSKCSVELFYSRARQMNTESDSFTSEASSLFSFFIENIPASTCLTNKNSISHSNDGFGQRTSIPAPQA